MHSELFQVVEFVHLFSVTFHSEKLKKYLYPRTILTRETKR